MITRVTIASCPGGEAAPCAFLVNGDKKHATETRSVSGPSGPIVVEEIPGPARLFSGHIHREGRTIDFQLRTLVEVECLDARAGETLWYSDHFARHTADEDTTISCVGIAAELTRDAPCRQGDAGRPA